MSRREEKCADALRQWMSIGKSNGVGAGVMAGNALACAAELLACDFDKASFLEMAGRAWDAMPPEVSGHASN